MLYLVENHGANKRGHRKQKLYASIVEREIDE